MLSTLKTRDYRLLWIGQGISHLGDQFHLIALPWLVLTLTHDPFQLGLVLALAGIPRAAVMLIGGAFAFSVSMGEFGATAMISRADTPTLPYAIFRYLSQPGSLNYGQAMAMSTLLMIVVSLGLISIERFRFGNVGEF